MKEQIKERQIPTVKQIEEKFINIVEKVTSIVRQDEKFAGNLIYSRKFKSNLDYPIMPKIDQEILDKLQINVDYYLIGNAGVSFKFSIVFKYYKGDINIYNSDFNKYYLSHIHQIFSFAHNAMHEIKMIEDDIISSKYYFEVNKNVAFIKELNRQLGNFSPLNKRVKLYAFRNINDRISLYYFAIYNANTNILLNSFCFAIPAKDINCNEICLTVLNKLNEIKKEVYDPMMNSDVNNVIARQNDYVRYFVKRFNNRNPDSKDYSLKIENIEGILIATFRSRKYPNRRYRSEIIIPLKYLIYNTIPIYDSSFSDLYDEYISVNLDKLVN